MITLFIILAFVIIVMIIACLVINHYFNPKYFKDAPNSDYVVCNLQINHYLSYEYSSPYHHAKQFKIDNISFGDILKKSHVIHSVKELYYAFTGDGKEWIHNIKNFRHASKYEIWLYNHKHKPIHFAIWWIYKKYMTYTKNMEPNEV